MILFPFHFMLMPLGKSMKSSYFPPTMNKKVGHSELSYLYWLAVSLGKRKALILKSGSMELASPLIKKLQTTLSRIWSLLTTTISNAITLMLQASPQKNEQMFNSNRFRTLYRWLLVYVYTGPHGVLEEPDWELWRILSSLNAKNGNHQGQEEGPRANGLTTLTSSINPVLVLSMVVLCVELPYEKIQRWPLDHFSHIQQQVGIDK